ncbi:MFS transporter [Nocardia vermiculata]|uniref:MFS transporter n=1 Tax=Nocardia vermiculata TaxID=257274 RepID=A0A846XZL8_9NOCA|nr:MFS transporter [Nocardia vermiculata]NKY50488.1 MFS transporter [Nocardia vermiculata]
MSTTVILPGTGIETGTSPARARWTLFAASFGFLMVSLDATIVNVALPTLGDQLGAGLSQLQWVVDSYTLVFAAFQLIGGTLADRIGARRAFTAGLVLFILASLICGLATSPAMLIAARFAQGLGAAFQLPASLAMVRHAYDDPTRRAHAVGLWAAAGGAAVAAGPVIGGVLLVTLGWRSLFLVNLVIGALGLLATTRAASAPLGSARRIDPVGQVTVVLSLCGLTYGLIEGGHQGWTSLPVLTALLAATAGIAFFARWESRVEDPMLPLSLFTGSTFSAASVVGFVQNFAYYGIVFLLSLFLQELGGNSALVTGLVFLPMSFAALTANLLGGRITAALGPRLPIVGGQIAFAAGLLALLFAGAQAPLWLICMATIPVGFGAGTVVPAMTSAVMEAVPAEYAGVASAQLNTARQVGGAVGVAVFGGLVAGDFLGGLQTSLMTAAVALLAAAAVGAKYVRRR